MMALRRSRCLIDLTSLQLIVDDEYEGEDEPSKSGGSDTSRLIDLKLSCMRLSAAGGETRCIQYSSDVSSSGLEVSLTVMALHLTSDAQKQSNTPLLAIQPAPLSPEGGALSVGGGPPADAITLHVPLPPDLMTATPTLSPIQPPSLQLGELLIDLKPTVSMRLVSRLKQAAEDAQLAPAAAAEEEEAATAAVGSPNGKPNSDDAYERMAGSSPTRRRASVLVNDLNEPDTTSRTLRATSILIHAATLTLTDDTLPTTSSPPPAIVQLTLCHVGLAFPPDQINVLLRSMCLSIGLEGSSKLSTLLRTVDPIRVSYSPGDAWTCEMALPSIHLHEPLLPAESIHTLFSHFKEVLTTIKPSTSASDGGASDAAATTESELPAR